MAIYERHMYDVDAIALYVSAKTYLSDDLLGEIKRLIEYHCKATEQNFDWHFNKGFPLVIPSDHNNFNTFFAIQLALCDLSKLRLVLNYQKSVFKGNQYAESDNLHGLIEFLICDHIKRFSAYETEKRMEIVMKWVEENKVQHKPDTISPPEQVVDQPIPEPITVPVAENEVPALKWMADIPLLKKISGELYLKGFTEKRQDFHDAFSGKACRWLKDHEWLAYFLFRLNDIEPKIVKAEKGKGYQQSAGEVFYDYSQKVAKKIDIKNCLYNVQKRYESDYVTMRGKIDVFLKENIPSHFN